jgi:hypothetical protein
MPWQLLADGAFSKHRPLEFIPDFQLGISLSELAKSLGGSRAELRRVTSDSFVWTTGQRLVPLRRMHESTVSVDAESLLRAERLAEKHVLAAQNDNGQFRYTLEPFTGERDAKSRNLARQAGTALALCELGRDGKASRRAIIKALRVFEKKERRKGDRSFLTLAKGAREARLASMALPLAALVVCRARVGNRFDALIARLSRGVLAMQRPDGSYFSHFDFDANEPRFLEQPLYAIGQVVLALGALEPIARQHPDAFPPVETLHDSVESTMRYVAHEYWQHPLSGFFYLEENWHCIAARALTEHHPNRDYENFCFDYIDFKSRLILEHGVAREFEGGFGFGNIVPPHNTGAAGFAEALSAALFIKAKRGEPLESERALLEKVLEFLLRQQWTEETCFACVDEDVIGSMSEHTHSPLSRIDYTQHLWSGIGQGRRALAIGTKGGKAGT